MIPINRTGSSLSMLNARNGTIAIITILALLAYLLTNMNSEYSEEVQVTSVLKPTPSELLPSGSATSGKLFNGREIRKFDESKLRLQNYHPSLASALIVEAQKDHLNCTHWSVVTTIFEPSEAVKKQALIPNWCLVVVGDKKGPSSYDIPHLGDNYIFLTPAKQLALADHFPIIDLLPWNHFARKNVGYLYAIWHGAQVVWDFDDDNILIDFMMNLSNPENFVEGYTVKAYQPTNFTSSQFNPYPLMGAETSPCWPRGYPLDHIKDGNPRLSPVNLKLSDIGVVQSLANGDPDVDAIYRLTQPLPFNFKTQKKYAYVAIPQDSWSPYNAQATLHLHNALWALLLPITVHGRVSDIWRSYMAQKIGRYLNLRFVFSYATVRQDRNAHNYLADFDSEHPLYLEATKLIEQLNDWILDANSIPGKIEQLWVRMYEHGYIEIEDVIMCQAWLQSLIGAGYDFAFNLPTSSIQSAISTAADSTATPSKSSISSSLKSSDIATATATATSSTPVTRALLRTMDTDNGIHRHNGVMLSTHTHDQQSVGGSLDSLAALEMYRNRPYAPSRHLF